MGVRVSLSVFVPDCVLEAVPVLEVLGVPDCELEAVPELELLGVVVIEGIVREEGRQGSAMPEEAKVIGTEV